MALTFMSLAASDEFSLSNLSLNSQSSTEDDWDCSETDIRVICGNPSTTTPRNSVLFPGGEDQQTPNKTGTQVGKRTISELLKVYAEKGTDVQFSPEEASRVADVLGQWINSGSSPYEGEDDFFARSHDDSSISTKRTTSVGGRGASLGRPRGSSESMVGSRPTSRTISALKS